MQSDNIKLTTSNELGLYPPPPTRVKDLTTKENIMYSGKFIDLPEEDKKEYITAAFVFKENQGWFSSEGEYAGADIQEVIRVLIDLEDAEINAIGDCMSGMCVTPPQLSDFVKKK